MDYLFTPWRFTYLINAGKTPGCVFCEQVKLPDREALIIHRGQDGNKRYGDEWLDQDILLLDLDELAVNINTIQELCLAENMLIVKKKN